MRDGETPTSTVRTRRAVPPLSRFLAIGVVVLLSALLVEVLLEGWAVIVLGRPSGKYLANGDIVTDPATWPKTLKSALYIGLLLLTVAKLAIDRRWAMLRTKADLAIAVAGVVLLISGLVGGTRPVVIGEALFVYFRGAIVLYALRVLNPSWTVIRRLMWVVGGFLAVNAAYAFVQIFWGIQSYRILGWTDLTWARTDRVHALLSHPNDLGHVFGLMVLGMVAWFVAKPTVSKKWWLLFTLMVIAMGAAQSRESTLAVLVGTVIVAVLRRAERRRLVIIFTLIIATTVAPLAYSGANRSEWIRRANGVLNAFHIPSDIKGNPGPSAGPSCPPNAIDCVSTPPQREIRVLYAQEGISLWAHRPALGYGIGQFGGIVAYRNDPNWNESTKFGPEGFDKFGFRAKTVDSFWLHLLVEGGALGIIAYLGWLVLLGTPMIGVVERLRRRRDGPAHPAMYWAPAAIAFGLIIGLLSPSLEDPLFPPLMFGIIGIAWVLFQRGELRAPWPRAGAGDGCASDGNAHELAEESAGQR